MQANLMGELSGALAARNQKSGMTPASASVGGRKPTAAVAENASPQILSAKQLFGKRDEIPRTPQDGDKPPPRRPGSARKLPSVAGLCLDGEFYGGKVRDSPFKPENETTPISGSTPTFIREETPKGQKAEALAVLAQRKRAVDATSLIVQTEFGDGEPSVRNRPKRSEEDVQRVMEARREHIVAMEEELKRNAGSGQPAIDADMALAMGGQLVHKMEKKGEASSVSAEHCKTPTERKKSAGSALNQVSTPGVSAPSKTGSTSKPATPAPAPLQGWTRVPNTPIGKASPSVGTSLAAAPASRGGVESQGKAAGAAAEARTTVSAAGSFSSKPQSSGQIAADLKGKESTSGAGASAAALSTAGMRGKEHITGRQSLFGRGLGQSAGNVKQKPKAEPQAPWRAQADPPPLAAEGKGEALMRRKQEELRRQLENSPSPGPTRARTSLAGPGGVGIDLNATPPLSGLDLEASGFMSPEVEGVMDLQVDDEEDAEGAGLLLVGLQLESDDY